MSPTRDRRHQAFLAGVPDLEQFPFDQWARMLNLAWRRPDRTLLVGGDPAGYAPLRRAIAAYLWTARAVRCTPDQVIIVAGVQQGIGLASHVLLDEGDKVWIEDPCYTGVHGALAGSGATTVAVPVDDQGLDVAAGERLGPDARLVCVTPSHHYPLGITMSWRAGSNCSTGPNATMPGSWKTTTTASFVMPGDRWPRSRDWITQAASSTPAVSPRSCFHRSGWVIWSCRRA